MFLLGVPVFHTNLAHPLSVRGLFSKCTIIIFNLGWWCCTSILSGPRLRSKGGLKYTCSRWEVTPEYGGQHPPSPGLRMPYTGQVAEYPKQACGMVEADTPPCQRGKGKKSPVFLPKMPNTGPEERKHRDFSPGFPRHIPGPRKEIYISDLIRLS